MIQPDVKLATLPTLPLPYYDQRVVVQLYKAAAVKCRTQHKDWILHPKVCESSLEGIFVNLS